jgi:RHS repeat-associated protein
MADPSEVATETAADPRSISDFAAEVIASYRNDLETLPNGISERTRELVRDYMTMLSQAGMYGFPDFLFQGGRQALREFVLGSLAEGSNSARPELTNFIDMRIQALALGQAVASFDSAQRNVLQAGDPIDLFSGQFTQDAVDLAIDGAGIEFAFRRSYRNQAVYFGPLGARWDHSYNLFLYRFGDHLIRSSGELREDVYRRHPRFGQAGFDYWMPPDGRHAIIEENGTSFVLRSPDGTRQIYTADAANPLFYRIQRIENRFGNYLAFSYADDQLRRIEINHPRRFASFEYGPDDHLAALVDHTGRRWRYAYDDYGDLVRVTSPVTARYPSGLTTRYEYSSADTAGPQQHNLIRIVDPAGQVHLENEYGINGGLVDFNRVIRQRQGNGESLYEYETVVNEFEFDYAPSEKPAFQVNLTQRNAQMVHYIFNAGGNLLLREERVGGPGLGRLNRSRHRYNRDGALVATLTADGCVTQSYFGRDDYLRAHGLQEDDPTAYDDVTASERLAFGSLLATVRRARRYDLAQMNLARGVWGDFFPDVIAALDANDIIVKLTYEPDFQQLSTISDPRFTARADPRYLESADYQRHLVRYEYSPPPARTLNAVRFPDCTYPSALRNGNTGITNAAEEYVRYDARGRLVRFRNAEGVTSENRYFSGTTAGVREGYLREAVLDPSALALITAYDVNEVGVVTSVTNPRGARTAFVVNELNQTIERISPGPGFRARSFFDENGLLARRERDNLDDAGMPSPDGDEVTTYRYDPQNQLLRESRGGEDLTRHHVTRHCYDAADQRVGTTLPRGNRLRFGYDERSLPTTTTRGAGTSLASTTRVIYNADGRAVATVDGRGNETRSRLDNFGRPLMVTDPLGNVQQFVYDKLSTVIISRFFERRPNGSFALLRRQSFDFDERGSRIRETSWLFQQPIATADIDASPDAEFDALRAQGDATPATTQFFYNRAKQIFRVLNANGQEVTYEYDTAGRRVLERDHEGNYIRTTYDENANTARVDRHELVRDPVTNAVLREDVFSLVHEYDLLDRRIATTDGLGNRTVFSYDSRDNLASVTDPLGNVVRYACDVFNRRERESYEMTDTGLGGGTRGPDVVTRFEYDDNDLLRATIDVNGNTTRGEHDELDRLYRITRPDGSIAWRQFDADDNIVGRTDSNGLRVITTVDAMKRLTAVDLDVSGVDPAFPYPAGAETVERYAYDGLGRALTQTNDFCAIETQFDSLGGAVEERFAFTTPLGAPAGPLTLRRGFDLLSNRTGLVLTSGRTLQFDFDTLNRLRLITHVADGAGYPGSATLGEPYSIAAFRYRGLRPARIVFGNTALSERGFDGGARPISIRHQTANLDVELQQLFDGAGNRRYEAEYDAGATAGARRFTFDSRRQLTGDRSAAITRVNPGTLLPPATPLALAAMVGQSTIDAVIGSLANAPANFTYRYDALGNRLEERQPGRPPGLQTHNALNQAVTVDGVAQRFDLNGNLLDDGERIYRYNYRNQLIEARQKTPDTEVARLFYDAQGRLIGLREGGQALHLVNDGLQVVEEYSAAGVLRQYVHGNGTDRHCQMAASGEEWWFHRDAVGSTRWLSDSQGVVAANSRFVYDAFGNSAAAIAHECPYLFTGRRLLADAQIYDMRARHYQPRTGRFLQRDPAGAVDGPNLYQYAGNNPVTLVDPMGTQKALADAEERKPLADEYFKGHAPSVEEQAQLGGLIRALLYLNPSSMGSPEMIKKTEEMADRLLPFAYAPQDLARAQRYEQMWSGIFTTMLNMWQFAGMAEEIPVQLAMRRLPAVPSNLQGEAAEVALRIEAANARTAAAAARPGYIPPAFTFESSSPFEGFVVNGRRIYGPFYRVGDPMEDWLEAIRTQSWGGRGVAGSGGDRSIAAALAYTGDGPVYPDDVLFRFFTDVKPSVGAGGRTAQWGRGILNWEAGSWPEGTWPGTIKGEDAAFVRILAPKVIKPR